MSEPIFTKYDYEVFSAMDTPDNELARNCSDHVSECDCPYCEELKRRNLRVFRNAKQDTIPQNKEPESEVTILRTKVKALEDCLSRIYELIDQVLQLDDTTGVTGTSKGGE